MGSQIRAVTKLLLRRYTHCRRLVMGWAGHHEPVWKVLIGTILSARSRDEQTSKATHALFRKYPTLERLAKADVQDIQKTIKMLGLNKQKARSVKHTARIVVDRYGGRVPRDEEALKELPGVGQKVADCVLLYGFGEAVIPVDTHVHKLSNLLGWVKTKTPEQTKRELERMLKGKERRGLNCLLISLGQETGYDADRLKAVLGRHLPAAAYRRLKGRKRAGRRGPDGRLPIEALGH